MGGGLAGVAGLAAGARRSRRLVGGLDYFAGDVRTQRGFKTAINPALVAAADSFAVSMSLRQLDLPLRSDRRWGTHFAWHVLNAVTLGWTSWATEQLELAKRAHDLSTIYLIAGCTHLYCAKGIFVTYIT